MTSLISLLFPQLGFSCLLLLRHFHDERLVYTVTKNCGYYELGTEEKRSSGLIWLSCVGTSLLQAVLLTSTETLKIKILCTDTHYLICDCLKNSINLDFE